MIRIFILLLLLAGCETGNSKGSNDVGASPNSEDTSGSSDPVDSSTGDTGTSLVDVELPLLCPTCSPVPNEEFVRAQDGEPPTCHFTNSKIGAIEAEQRGYPVSNYIAAITGEFSVPVRWATKDQEIIVSVAFESTNSYVLVQENVPDGGRSECSLSEYLMIGISADIRTSDNSFVGVLNGFNVLRLEPLNDYVLVGARDSEAILRGNLTIDYGERGLPVAVSSSIILVHFPEGQQDTRLVLEIYVLYDDEEEEDGRKNWVGVTVASSNTGCTPDSPYGEVCFEHHFDYVRIDTDSNAEDTDTNIEDIDTSAEDTEIPEECSGCYE